MVFSTTSRTTKSREKVRASRPESLETLHWHYSVEQRTVIPIKWLVLLLSVALFLVEDRSLFRRPDIFGVFAGYTLLNVLFSWLFIGRKVRVPRFRIWSLASLAADLLFVSVLTLLTGGLKSEFYFLFFFPILRSAALFQDPYKKFWVDVFMTAIYLAFTIPATPTGTGTEPLTLLVLRVTLIWGVILMSSFLVQVITSQQARIVSINDRLRYQSDQNREVLSSMTDAVLVFDPSQQLRLCNWTGEQLLARIFGVQAPSERRPYDQNRRQLFWVQPPRLWGNRFQPLWEDEDADFRFWTNRTPDEIATPVERLLEEARFRPEKRVMGVPITLEERSGRKRSLIASVAAIGQSAEGHLGWLLLLRDISEYQALEAQLLTSEKLAAVGRLAAGLAHELGNPLGIIKSCAHYLQKKIGPESQLAEETQVLASEAERCERILRQLLAFASQDEPRIEEIDLKELLEKSINLIAYQAPDTVELSLASSLEEAPARTDDNLLTQALVNLLLNAVQAIEGDGKVAVQLTAGEGEDWRVTIVDNGCGMGKETLSRLYDPFYTTKPNGTGLGLAITQRIIHRLGGSISVKSDRGKGTEFTILLPRRLDERESVLVV